MLVELISFHVVCRHDSQWEQECYYHNNPYRRFVPVTDLRNPQYVIRNDETGKRGKTHTILTQCVSRIVDCILHRVHRDHVAYETSPVGHGKEETPAVLDLLDVIVAYHCVVLTQLVLQQAFVMLVSMSAQLQVRPEVMSVLSQENSID